MSECVWYGADGVDQRTGCVGSADQAFDTPKTAAADGGVFFL